MELVFTSLLVGGYIFLKGLAKSFMQSPSINIEIDNDKLIILGEERGNKSLYKNEFPLSQVENLNVQSNRRKIEVIFDFNDTTHLINLRDNSHNFLHQQKIGI